MITEIWVNLHRRAEARNVVLLKHQTEANSDAWTATHDAQHLMLRPGVGPIVNTDVSLLQVYCYYRHSYAFQKIGTSPPFIPGIRFQNQDRSSWNAIVHPLSILEHAIHGGLKDTLGSVLTREVDLLADAPIFRDALMFVVGLPNQRYFTLWILIAWPDKNHYSIET